MPVNLPLLPKAYTLIEKYKDVTMVYFHQRLFPYMSNQRLNKYIKEIAELCGVKKELSFHSARHTFATTVLLCNDVPMETAMELLVHTDIRTTQIYGKIVQKKISNDMQVLKQKLLKNSSEEKNLAQAQ